MNPIQRLKWQIDIFPKLQKTNNRRYNSTDWTLRFEGKNYPSRGNYFKGKPTYDAVRYCPWLALWNTRRCHFPAQLQIRWSSEWTTYACDTTGGWVILKNTKRKVVFSRWGVLWSNSEDWARWTDNLFQSLSHQLLYLFQRTNASGSSEITSFLFNKHTSLAHCSSSRNCKQ